MIVIRNKTFAITLLLLLFLLVGCGHTVSKNYVGSINSNKYHYPNCEWALKIKPENKVWFNTEEEALEAGYKSCKTCRK